MISTVINTHNSQTRTRKRERLAGASSGTGRGEESTILRDCEKEREKDRRSLLNCGTAGDLARSAVAAVAAGHD